jgi:head-tail adaptor
MSGAVFTGQLRRRVTLLMPVSTIDNSGFQSRIYTNGPQIWAHIRTVQMAGRYGADRQEGLVTHHITFRSLSPFGAGYRFVLGARIFEVVSFQDCEGLPCFMRAYCQEIQP